MDQNFGCLSQNKSFLLSWFSWAFCPSDSNLAQVTYRFLKAHVVSFLWEWYLSYFIMQISELSVWSSPSQSVYSIIEHKRIFAALDLCLFKGLVLNSIFSAPICPTQTTLPLAFASIQAQTTINTLLSFWICVLSSASLLLLHPSPTLPSLRCLCAF